MRFAALTRVVIIAALAACCSACMSVKNLPDYGAYRSAMPRSVLVLPPTNDSIEVEAPYVYLSTVTQPLAEAGYYVFPVAVVDNFMKENGLPTPYEMHALPLAKIDQVFGADAVLYLHIEDFGQKYQILNSSTIVNARAKLVEVKSGAVIWQGSAQAVERSGNGGDGGLLGMAINAAVAQVVHSGGGRLRELSSRANRTMIFDTEAGLLLGPYHPDFAEDVRGR